MRLTKLLSTTAILMSLALPGAAFADHTEDHAKGGEAYHEHMQEVLSQLPAEKATLFKDTMKATREKNKPLRDQLHKLYSDRDAILTADKFDKDAFNAKNAELDKIYDQMRANTNQSFVSVAAQFTADERKVLAKIHKEPMKHDGEESRDQSKSK
jgi:uncharacterized membrane protein